MKKLLYNIAFSLASAGLILLAGELILASAYNLTHNSKFSTLMSEDSRYPKNSEGCLKIAIFGGSAAFGYNSERGFSDILDYELKKQHPQIKFYIKNYAQCGYPFHLHQAESLKAVIDKYDIFIIICGHNEVNNYLDDVGYFRAPKYKKLKTLVPLKTSDQKQSLIGLLQNKSRIYAIFIKGFRKLIALIKPDVKGADMYEYKEIREFSFSKVLPPEEIAKIGTNFAEDLEEVAKLATQKGKIVLISSIPVNESWKPFFSAYRRGITEKEITAFQENYKRGLESYKHKDYQKAVSSFLVASQIDNSVAILNYMLGESYLMLNEREKARRYLYKSVDNDGYPIRALSAIRNIEKSISTRYNRVFFTDTVFTFYNLLDGGLTYNELFSDLQHPTFLGHTVIANNFLYLISQMPAFKSYSATAKYSDLDPSALRSLVEYYKKELNVTQKDESFNALMISRWYAGMSRVSAYPEDFLNAAQDYVDRFYEKSDKGLNDAVMKLFFLALIESEREKGVQQKTIDLLNQAYGLSPTYAHDILYNRRLNTGELFIEAFNKKGIFYAKDRKSFIKKSNKLLKSGL